MKYFFTGLFFLMTAIAVIGIILWGLSIVIPLLPEWLLFIGAITIVISIVFGPVIYSIGENFYDWRDKR
jgi:hypothetical protein